MQPLAVVLVGALLGTPGALGQAALGPTVVESLSSAWDALSEQDRRTFSSQVEHVLAWRGIQEWDALARQSGLAPLSDHSWLGPAYNHLQAARTQAAANALPDGSSQLAWILQTTTLASLQEPFQVPNADQVHPILTNAEEAWAALFREASWLAFPQPIATQVQALLVPQDPAPGDLLPSTAQGACMGLEGSVGPVFIGVCLLQPVLFVVAAVLVLALLPVFLALQLLAQPDQNSNGLGDEWEKEWTALLGQILQAATDLDTDGLPNLDEFRWQLVPACAGGFTNCRDHENDEWQDGPEVTYWNDGSNDLLQPGAAVAVYDPDRLVDTDADGLPNVKDPDSDNDGLLDGGEVATVQTYPEFADSDCALEATACTPSTGSRFHATNRQGQPGTGDGLNDGQELAAWMSIDGSAWFVDYDGDGLTNNLLDPDSDGDTLLDGEEITLTGGQVRPDRVDTDADTLRDGDEPGWHVDTDNDGRVNANDPDSDNDGMPDGWEQDHAFNPVDPTDAALDRDADGLSNLGEYQHGTDPFDPDSEGDELQDGPEVLDFQTDPFQWDTDTDGLPDAWEARFHLQGDAVAADPLASDAFADPDADRFTAPWCTNAGSQFHNRAEYVHAMPSGWDSRPTRAGGDGVWWDGTFANDPDTDDDGLPDGYEVCSGSNPRLVDFLGADDTDRDGLNNAEEVSTQTRFDAADTDGDGLCDGGRGENCQSPAGTHGPGETKDYATDPLDTDTDDEGWLDGPEAAFWDPAATGHVPDSDLNGQDNLHQADSDGDGLNDDQEFQSLQGSEGSDPGLADTDADGLLDPTERGGWDTSLHGNPLHVTSHPGVQDTDTDGLTDLEEHRAGPHPRLADSDGDTLNDAVEVHGWTIVVDGVARTVTSDPRQTDGDADGLADSVEFLLGTDPLAPDTDADGMSDAVEDEDRDGQPEEGETSPTTTDSDHDGVGDGLEQSTYASDPLEPDSDEDGLDDGLEAGTYGTSLILHDTDDDYLADGEEVGEAAAGGDPNRVTDPLDPDTDGDGFLDGEEVHFWATHPLAVDTDCDGAGDATDPNPYTPNVPPGQARPPESRFCPTAPRAASPAMVPPLDSLLPPLTTASAENPDDVGLLIFDEEGTVTVLARSPASEAPILVVQAVLALEGRVRTSASGTLADETAHATAELQPIGEAGAEDSGNPYTHSVRVALPEGMVEATGATFSITFLDENLNSATYTGQATGFQLHEVEYQDDLNTADQQDWDDPSEASVDSTGWDYVRTNVTGGQDETGPAGASVGDDDSWTQGLWVFHVTQPQHPTLGGAIVDDALVLVPWQMLEGTPVRTLLYTDTVQPVDPEDLDLLTTQGWFKSGVKAFKKVAQATSKAWSATVQVTTSAAQAVNQAGQQVKKATLAIYDEVANPRTPAAFALRFALDIVGVGDVIDIIEGVRTGDWAQIGLGVAGLAMTVVPVLKGPVAAAKGTFRVAKAAGASEELVAFMGRSLDDFARQGAEAAPKIERWTDAAKTASGKGRNSLDGLEVLAKVQGADTIGTQPLVKTGLHADFLAQQAATKTKAGAEELARGFPANGPVSLDTVAKGSTKARKYTPDMPEFTDCVKRFNTNGVSGIDGVARSATKMALKQGKGHVYTVVKACANIGRPGQSLDFSFRLSNSHMIRPDEIFLDGGSSIYREYKNYDRVFSLTTHTKKQLIHYAMLCDEAGGVAEYVIKNGQVSKGVRDLVAKLNADKLRIRLQNDAGLPIV